MTYKNNIKTEISDLESELEQIKQEMKNYLTELGL